MLTLHHPFAFHNDLNIVLKGTNSLPAYLKKLRSFARTKRAETRKDGELDPAQLKCIGDGFELFGEVFLKLCGPQDNRIWVKDFRRLDISDNGVDGEGACANTGNRVFVQFKCYGPTEWLTGTGSHLDSFVAETSMLLEDEYAKTEKPYIPPRRIVITSAAGIHRYTADEKYRGRVECFPHDALTRLVEAPTFWDAFREAAHI